MKQSIVYATALWFGVIATAHAGDATLYKTPGCNCCDSYANYMRDNGFEVDAQATHDLSAMSRQAGIPDNFQGCHLVRTGDYFVSGHVPIDAINKLLTEKPDIDGITLPGMPKGSPGMSGTRSGPLTTYAISAGKTTIYTVE